MKAAMVKLRHAYDANPRRYTDVPAGWPLPVQETRVHRTAGSLVLSGHRHEPVSPYEWTTRMRGAIGGTLFTVEDDMHGSAIRESDCAAELVSYFLAGRLSQGCQGVAAP
ncbi:alpha/beta hydrolase [Nonomuraea zeae]